MKKKFGFSFFIFVLVLCFLYLPILILFINSFNDTKYNIEWCGFTLKWYKMIFYNRELIDAIFNSIFVGIISMLFSMIIGTIAAFCIFFYNSKLQFIHKNIFLIQLVIPDIFIGISLLFFFTSVINFGLSLITVVLAHITFCIVYVIIVVDSRLQNLSLSIIESARDLGANWFDIYKKILIPITLPSILSGGLLAFTISIDDFVVTSFVAGPGKMTLPIYIYSAIKHGDFEIINALSVFMIIFTVFLIFCLKNFLFSKNKLD